MPDYLVFDIETTYGKTYGRVGNRWDADFGLCSAGWLRGNGDYFRDYTVSVDVSGVRVGMNPMFEQLPMPDLTDVSYLVGHNLKFDLLWYWDHPELIKFFKNGGRVFDTMYAEFLLSGQLYNRNAQPDYKINLKQCAIRRKLSYQKQDIVKALWDSGIRTEDISPAILMEYMEYDIRTTEELFKAQVAQARAQGQVRMIQNSMDGLLATTEMEFNGICMDKDLALKQAEELEKELAVLRARLDSHIPELPEGCEFKWGSWKNLSALLFGGELKYTGKEDVLDEKGNKTYFQKKVLKEVLDELGNKVIYKSGKKAGEVKTKAVTVPDIERGPKQRNCIKTFTLPQLTKPSSRWASSEEPYPDGTPRYYSTSKDVIEKLKGRGIGIVDDLLAYRGIDKDLGTYYIRTKIVKGREVQSGMLTNIQPTDSCVHGSINHDVAVTRRLSADSPNLQNINAKGNIKKAFVSRFINGVIAEIDYNQLEVITQAVNSGDKNLLQALMDGKCFHCEWLAFAEGMTYEEVYELAKVQKLPEWTEKRQNIKALNFGEAYGAGIPTLCENSGLDADIVERAIEGRKKTYPDLYSFHDKVFEEVQSSRTLTRMRTEKGYQRCVGYYRSVTGTVYHFLENEAPEFKQKQGVMTAFSPTTIKNYPSQGLGGEIMQTMMGLVWRMLVRFDLRDKIKLVLTVHDSLYPDCISVEVAKEYIPKISAVLEDVCWYFGKCFEDVKWDNPFPVSAEYGKNMKEVGSKKDISDAIRGSIKERDYEWVELIHKEFK